MSTPASTWYHRLVTPDPEGEADAGGTERVARNGLRQITAQALQSAGDQVVNAKTVLPWILTGVGAPAALVALLVPIREAGSMLPQAALTPRVVRAPRRARVWAAGSLVQAAAVLGMGAAAAFLSGAVAGFAIVGALAVFSLGRALGSMAAKDVQGRTLPKGQRGQISGISTVAAGVVAVAVGLGLRAFGEGLSPGILAVFLVGAAVAWVAAGAIYRGIEEDPPADSGSGSGSGEGGGEPWWREMLTLLARDAPFRTFVIVRALLLVSALTPPFFVTLAADHGNTWLSGLGGFVIASALAAILGGGVAGRLADRSSKTVMSVGAGLASVVVLAVVLVVWLADDATIRPVLILAFFLVSLVHVGIRVGRKTYVVDMAEGDQRTQYVAVSNTAMGVILLVTGAVSSGLATFGELPALVFLGVLGVAGAVLGARLPEVSKR
ncbi:MAG: MFS transporter [bacterium]|nr:MFS transporter [bacterium]